MIYALARAVEDNLRARKYPVRVCYRGEHAPTASDYITLTEASTPGAVRPPPGAQGTGLSGDVSALRSQVVFMREIPFDLRIFVKSPKEGARANEHAERAELYVDAVLSALYVIAKKNRWPSLNIGGPRHMTHDELTALGQTWTGAVVQILGSCPRAVVVRDYEGAPDTAQLADVDTSIAEPTVD